MKKRSIALFIAAILAVPIFAQPASAIRCSRTMPWCWRYEKRIGHGQFLKPIDRIIRLQPL
jgi:hypothetical protein